MKGPVKIILKPGKEKSLLRFHPWVFSGAIQNITGPVSEGDLVELNDGKGKFLALGHYQIGSIAVRIVSFENVETGYEFWKRKIEAAFNLRIVLDLVDNKPTNLYRLVNAEGDFMPGLIVDFYNGIAVLRMHSIAMYLIRRSDCTSPQGNSWKQADSNL